MVVIGKGNVLKMETELWLEPMASQFSSYNPKLSKFRIHCLAKVQRQYQPNQDTDICFHGLFNSELVL